VDRTLDPALRISLRAAACLLAGERRDPAAGARVRRAVEAQLRRAGVDPQDRDDVRTDVVLALLATPAADDPLPLELACARAAVIARNKAIDHGRRRARAPIALGDDLPEPERTSIDPGSLADGLDEVAAHVHRRRVRAELAGALERLDAPARAAISAHALGGAARAAGLPRSTYYRVLARAQTRLRSDLRGRIAGIGALGGVLQRLREVLQHVEAVHGAAAAATAAVAVTAAVVLGTYDHRVHRAPAPKAPVAIVAGGRVAPPPIVIRRPPPDPQALPPATPPPPARRSTRAAPSPAAASRPSRSCPYDPSTYDC
jgi:DNA-directed RNA polymerase specialized sigma24 family protein